MLSTLLVARPRAELRDGQVVMNTPKIEVVASSENEERAATETPHRTTSVPVDSSTRLPELAKPHSTNTPKIEVLEPTSTSPLDTSELNLQRNAENKPSTEILIPGSAGVQKRSILSGNPQTLLPTLHAESISVHDTSRAFRETQERSISVGAPRYGFGQRYSGVFTARAEDLTDIVELPDPDSTPAHARVDFRRAAEDAKFDLEHYAADYMLAHEFAHVFEYSPKLNLEDTPLTNEQKDALLKLPRREYLSDVDKDACSMLGGLLYAWCYDMRITQGEGSVESAWTISRICASLSFLEVLDSPTMSVRVAHKRSLAYPLYRHFELSGWVLGDLQRLVETVKVGVDKLRGRLLRVLLHVRSIFENDKMLRVFADIFLTDYCVWVQYVEDEVLLRFAREVGTVRIGKEEVGWGLSEIEEAARAGPSNGTAEEMGSAPGEIIIGGVVRDGLEMTTVSTRTLGEQGDVESDTTSTSSSSSTTSEEEEVGRSEGLSAAK